MVQTVEESVDQEMRFNSPHLHRCREFGLLWLIVPVFHMAGVCFRITSVSKVRVIEIRVDMLCLDKDVHVDRWHRPGELTVGIVDVLRHLA